MDIQRPPDGRTKLFSNVHVDAVPLGSAVTVTQHECCVVVKGGQPVGKLDAGRWALDPGGVPFLQGCVEPGNHLGTLDLVFITTIHVQGTQFGGRLGRMLERESGASAQVMATGVYTIKVSDPFAVARSAASSPDSDAFLRNVSARLVKAAQGTLQRGFANGQLTFDRIDQQIFEFTPKIVAATSAQLTSEGVQLAEIERIAVHLQDQQPGQPAAAGSAPVAQPAPGPMPAPAPAAPPEKKKGKSKVALIGCIVAVVLGLPILVLLLAGLAGAVYWFLG